MNNTIKDTVKTISKMSTEDIFKEYIYEINKHRIHSTVGKLCFLELQDRLGISNIEKIKDLYPEYFL